MFRQVDPECEHDPGDTAPSGRDEQAPSPEQPQIFSLLACPPIEAGNFALVRKDETGEPKLLMAGRAPFAAPTLNRALIRQHGAVLGATEVHVWARRK